MFHIYVPMSVAIALRYRHKGDGLMIAENGTQKIGREGEEGAKRGKRGGGEGKRGQRGGTAEGEEWQEKTMGRCLNHVAYLNLVCTVGSVAVTIINCKNLSNCSNVRFP